MELGKSDGRKTRLHPPRADIGEASRKIGIKKRRGSGAL